MSYVSPFTGDVIQPTDVSFRAFNLSSNLTLSWPINGNATGNYAARIMDVTPTGAGFSLSMPPANQTSVGTDALIRNLGAVAFTVKDYVGGTIVSVAAGTAQYVYLTTNPNTAGTWGVIAFGAGSSGGNAATAVLTSVTKDRVDGVIKFPSGSTGSVTMQINLIAIGIA